MKFLSISLILLSKGGFVFSRCSGKDGLVCCSGTVWDNVKQKCVECDPGYYGLNCTNECQYPTYGKTCQFECSCTEEFCDIATGCGIQRVSQKTEGQVSKLVKELTVSKEFEQETSHLKSDVTTHRMSNIKAEKSLTILDIEKMLKENNSEAWKIGFIVVSIFSTCMTVFTISSLIHKGLRKLKRSEKSSGEKASDGSGQYNNLDLIESNLKIDRVIFEGLANAKIGHCVAENVYALQLNALCPNTDIDRSNRISQECENANENPPSVNKSNLLPSREYVEPTHLNENDKSLVDVDHQCCEESQMLDSVNKTLYLTVTN